MIPLLVIPCVLLLLWGRPFAKSPAWSYILHALVQELHSHQAGQSRSTSYAEQQKKAGGLRHKLHGTGSCTHRCALPRKHGLALPCRYRRALLADTEAHSLADTDAHSLANAEPTASLEGFGSTGLTTLPPMHTDNISQHHNPYTHNKDDNERQQHSNTTTTTTTDHKTAPQLSFEDCRLRTADWLTTVNSTLATTGFLKLQA